MLNSEMEDQEFQFGDIIIARRYKNGHEKLKIDVGHRVGLFIVIDKVDDKYVCVYGTTKNIYNKEHDVIEFNNSERKTYFVLDNVREIEKSNIAGKLDSLDERKKEILRLKLKREKIEEKKLEIGDIISFNNALFFVYSISPVVVLIGLNRNNFIRNNLFSVFGKEYSFDFDSVSIYGSIDNYEIVDYLDNDQMQYIKKCKYFFQNKLIDSSRKLERGMLIEYVGRLYYVYGTDKENALLYEVFEDGEKLKNNCIYVNGKAYTAFFKNMYEVNVNSLYILKDVAVNCEIENNKNVKKNYLKSHKENKKVDYSDYIVPSALVSDKSAAKVKYVVLFREDSRVILIPLEEIEKGNYKAITIREIKHVVLCGRYDEDKFYDVLCGVSKYNDWFLTKEDKEKVKKKIREDKRNSGN